jgi:hypothetical protein
MTSPPNRWLSLFPQIGGVAVTGATGRGPTHGTALIIRATASARKSTWNADALLQTKHFWYKNTWQEAWEKNYNQNVEKLRRKTTWIHNSSLELQQFSVQLLKAHVPLPAGAKRIFEASLVATKKFEQSSCPCPAYQNTTRSRSH